MRMFRIIIDHTVLTVERIMRCLIYTSLRRSLACCYAETQAIMNNDIVTDWISIQYLQAYNANPEA